jgi:hypothetical protein
MQSFFSKPCTSLLVSFFSSAFVKFIFNPRVTLILEDIEYFFIAIGVTAFLELFSIIFAGLLIFHKNASLDGIVFAREHQDAQIALVEPIQTQNQDTVPISQARTRSSVAPSQGPTPESFSGVVATVTAYDSSVPERLVSVDLGNGRTISIDEESGLQVASPVSE